MNSEERKTLVQQQHSYLDWLDSEIAGMESYHNHKETMAWSATAAYVTVLVLAYNAAPHLHRPVLRILFSLFLFAVGSATFIFINMQFQMRWVAADHVTALRRFKVRLLSTSYSEFKEMDLSIPALGEASKTAEMPQWPTEIAHEISICQTKRQAARQWLWMFFPLWIFLPGNLETIKARLRSEIASYIVMVAVTVIAIGTVWIQNPENDLASRLQAIEQKLSAIEQRLSQLEQRIP